MRYFFLAFVLTVSALTAFAQASPTVSALWPSPGDYPAYSRTGSFSCAVNIASGDPRWTFNYTQMTGNSAPPHHGGTYYGWDPTGNGTYTNCYKTVEKPWCPQGYEWDGQDLCKQQDPCQAKTGYYDNAGDPQIVQLPGPGGVYTGKAVDGKVPGEICISGCSANPRLGYDYVGGVLKDGTYYVQGNPKYTGTSCGDRTKTPDYAPMPKNSPEYDCVSKGQNFGYVNGAVTCTSKTTPNEASGKTTTTVKDNGDGTKLETKTSQSISCSGAGSCVTTTTTTTTIINSDGSRGASVTRTDGLVTQGPVSGSGTTSGPQVDKSDPFCVSNPNSPMCKSGSFSGSCDAQPACEGDPVQCAVAIATWKTDCKTLKPGTPPIDTPAVTEKKIGNQFSASDIGSGGGSCPNPRVLSIAGQSISVEFTPICDFASAIRPVVILLGWICAGYIVLGRSGGARNG